MVKCREKIARIIAIEDTPHAIALGVAIGILFGITPLFGIKMPLAAALSFIARGNVLATLIVVGLGDILVPLLTVVYFLEYKIGCLIFFLKSHYTSADLIDEPAMMPYWIEVAKKGLPLLVGSLIVGVMAAIPSYGIVRFFLDKKCGRVSSQKSNSGTFPEGTQ